MEGARHATRSAGDRIHPIDMAPRSFLLTFALFFRKGGNARAASLTLIGLSCCVLLIPGAGLSQSSSAQSQPPVMRVQTEVVNVYAVVTDKHGHVIPNLTRDDFEIEDNGAPQKISYFSVATDTPLTLGIMVDTSPSQKNILLIEQEQAKSFLRQVMRPKDLAFVLHFDLQVELLQDFTPDIQSLLQAIDETVINGGGQGPLPGTFPGAQEGYTHLYDAVWLACSDQLMGSQVGRKVLILLTDGQDEGSKESLDSAIKAAQKADVMIYSINIVDRRMYATYNEYGGGYAGESVLKKMAEQTGGEYIHVRGSKDTYAAFQEIANQLRTQYLLGYTPTDRVRNGSYHNLRVRVQNKDYSVQARRGYYATTIADASASASQGSN